MADFTSSFWSWFIIIPTVLGIAGCFWLIIANTDRRKTGETQQTMGHVWDGDLKEYNNPLPRWWLNMFYITLVFGIIYLLLYPGLGAFRGLLGWSQEQAYEEEIAEAEARYGPLYAEYAATPIRELARNDQAMKTGGRLFANYCAQCHGSDARGAAGFPNLRDREWLWGGEPDAIRTSILNGRQGAMPAWGDVLQENGVLNVAEYVRSLSGQRVDFATAEAGKAQYQQFCVACHGPEGKGNPQLGAPDLTNGTWLYGGSQRAIMRTISGGRQGVMPAHEEFLGEDKVHLLAAYVYSLSTGEAGGE